MVSPTTPVTITIPGPGTIGPGIPVNLRSDFIGPLGQDAEWVIGVWTGPTFELQYCDMAERAFSVQTATYYMASPTQSLQTTSTAQPAAGETVRVIATLRESGQVLDTGSIETTWDPTLGLGMQAALTGRASGGGFTAQDRAQLAAAVSNTTINLADTSIPNPANGIPISRLPGALPVVWGRRTGPYLLTGRDTLDLPTVIGPGAYIGMRWFYTVIPPGWGMTPGAIDEFKPRPAQLVPIMRLDSGEEVGNPIMDTDTSGGFYAFDVGFFSGRMRWRSAFQPSPVRGVTRAWPLTR